MQQNEGLRQSKATKSNFVVIPMACAFGVYCGNILNIFSGLTYMQASALAGASIFPAIVGGVVGYSVYYRFILKFPFFAAVSAVALGITTHAIIGSYLVEPVNGNEATLISYGEHLKSFSSGLCGGIVSGILFAFFLKKGKIIKKAGNSQ
jgi:hypothetical protein